MVAEYLLQISSSCNPFSSWVADEYFALVYPDLVEKYSSRCFNDGNNAKMEEGGAGYSSDVMDILMEGNIDGLKWGQADHFLHMNPQFKQVDGPSMSLISPTMRDALSSVRSCIGNINCESSSNCEMPPLRDINSGMVHFEKHSNTALSVAADKPPPLRNINGCAQESKVSKNNVLSGVLAINPSCGVMSISPMKEVHPMNGTADGSFVPKITAEKDISDSNTGEGDRKKRMMVTRLPVVEVPSSRKAKERLNQGEVDTIKSFDTYRTPPTTPNTLETPLSIKIAESLNTALERIEPSYLMAEEECRIEKLHEQQGVTFTCHVCGIDYTSQLALASHLRTHKKNNSPVLSHNLKHRKHEKCSLQYQCQYCVESFRTDLNLAYHIRIQHRKEHKRLPVCPYCQTGFVTDSALANHILTQHNKINLHEKRLVPYQCQYCEESLGSNSALVRHIQVRHGKELKLLPWKKVKGSISNGGVSHSTSKSSEPVSSYKYLYCLNGFETDSALDNHILTEHNKIKL